MTLAEDRVARVCRGAPDIREDGEGGRRVEVNHAQMAG